MNNITVAAPSGVSPFDSIRGYRADGSEYWMGRELMRWLGYAKWQNAEKAIERAKKSLENQGYISSDHLTEVSNDSRSNGLGVQSVKDFELSRLGCYTVAMNADPEKQMVALAQGYFTAKTREAEIANTNKVDRLEQQFRPETSTQNKVDAIKILEAGGHAKEYIQRVSLQMAKAICPDIETPDSLEMVSLPTTKALLNPTQIAEHLQLFCKSNSKSGDARQVNKMLESLGYQEKIAGCWSSTQKAIDLNLCDRKPVDTNSRTQKDQLLWSSDILPIISDHIGCQIAKKLDEYS